MQSTKNHLSRKQELFREMVLGTLVYAVVLGFFNDYTNILYTKSFSITFLVAVVMQLLTYATFSIKDRVVRWFQGRSGTLNKTGLVVAVWLVMFFSKFVFLEVIDIAFGSNVEISSFVGLIFIIVAMTLVKAVIDYVFQRLAD